MDCSSTHYDLIVLGTGLVESMVAAAAARDGKSVLQLDPLPRYGHAWMTSSSLSEWLEVLLGEERTLLGLEDVSVCVPSAGLSCRAGGGTLANAVLAALPADLSASQRGWHLELMPRPILGAGPIVDALVAVGAHQYSEFRLVGTSLCRAEGKGGGAAERAPSSGSARASSSLATAGFGATGLRSRLAAAAAGGARVASSGRSSLAVSSHPSAWMPVPSSRSQVFTSRSLTLRQKRSLASMLSSMQALLPPPIDQEAREDDLVLAAREARRSEAAIRPFLEVAREQGMDDALARIVWHGVLLLDGGVDDAGSLGHALDALELLRSSAIRLAAYGAGTQLVPAYGTSDLPQGFCRSAAVKGALQALRTGIQSIAIEDRTVEVKAEPRERESGATCEPKEFREETAQGEKAGEKQEEAAAADDEKTKDHATADGKESEDKAPLDGDQSDLKKKNPPLPPSGSVTSHATVRLDASTGDAYGPSLPEVITCGALCGAGALLRNFVAPAASSASASPTLRVLVALLSAPPLAALSLDSSDAVAALVAPHADGPPVRGLALGRASGTCPQGHGVVALWARAERREDQASVAEELQEVLKGIIEEETQAKEEQNAKNARDEPGKDAEPHGAAESQSNAGADKDAVGETPAASTDTLSNVSRDRPYVLLTASYSLPLGPSRLAAPSVAECAGPSAAATADGAADDARRLFAALFRTGGDDAPYPLDRAPPPPEDEASDDEALLALDRALAAVGEKAQQGGKENAEDEDAPAVAKTMTGQDEKVTKPPKSP